MTRAGDGTPLRVAVWGTGGVGALAVGAVARRPDLELVAVRVHDPAKVGVDAGPLAGLGPLGVVNAVPAVPAAPPGLVGALDLPLTLPVRPFG